MLLVGGGLGGLYLTRTEAMQRTSSASPADVAKLVQEKVGAVVNGTDEKIAKTRSALEHFQAPRYPAFTGTSATIPLRAQLSMVHSQWQPGARGDFEAEVRFERPSNDTLAMVMTSFRVEGTPSKTYELPTSALRTASVFTTNLCYDDPCRFSYATVPTGNDLIPDGWVGWFLPATAFEELSRAGRTTLRLRYEKNNTTATATAAQPSRVAFPVLLNGKRTTVAALHVRARTDGVRADSIDLHILDDPRNPLVLEMWWWNRQSDRQFLSGLRATRIAFPTEARVIEQELATARRTAVYGIYFAFGSSELLPTSEPVLREIAGTLDRNGDWRVRIEGHTDSIGTGESNQALSERRAAAVRDALVRRFGIDSVRLSVAGFGARVPVDSNSTLMGRARNRRVELIRE